MAQKNSIDFFFFVNSYIDKRGSIGYRAGKIIQHLSSKNLASICLCKSYETQTANVKFISLFLLKVIIRTIKLIRILTKGSIDHRIIDIYLFEKIAIFLLKTKYRNYQIKVAHLWEYCPRLIEELKKRNVCVILDVPIAPATYAERVSKDFDLKFMRQNRRMIKIQNDAFRVADKIVVPSAFVFLELEKLNISRKKISIVEFGAENNSIIHDGNIKLKKSGTDFCFLGVLSPRKGLIDILNVWNDQIFENDRLHLCGRVYPEIRDMINKNKLENIILHGFINPYEFLHNYDVFLLPSWMEGSSKSVYEAMASGLPSIVSYSSGSIIRHKEDGFIINAGDRYSLRKYMIRLKTNEALAKKMGEAALRNVAKYSWTRYCEKVESLY